MDLYPSFSLMASNIARWRQVSAAAAAAAAAEGEGSGGYHRVNSFRESALEIFQQVQPYSEVHLHHSLHTGRLLRVPPSPHHSHLDLLKRRSLLRNQCSSSPVEPTTFLRRSSGWPATGEVAERICLTTLPTAVEIGLKLRASVVAGDDSAAADPFLVRFEHLYDLWGLDSPIDRSLFPEISFRASRTVSDVFDVLSRISSCTPLLETSATSLLVLRHHLGHSPRPDPLAP
jgi:hypothetical protein